MLSSISASLSGLLPLVGAILLPVSLLGDMNYIIRIRRFNLLGPRVPSSLNLAASLLILVALGIGRGLLLL
jgi:hypothetical protein